MGIPGAWYHIAGILKLSSQHLQPLMLAIDILPVLVHAERLSRLTPATLGTLKFVLTSS